MSEFYPKELQRLPIWILWRIEQNEKGNYTKVPYSANYEGHASSTNPKHWSSIDKARAKQEQSNGKYNGLGIAISKEYGLVFIDIDHCINADTGEMSETAQSLIDIFKNQYIEISQSGQGIHIITKGTIPKGFNNRIEGVEMYADSHFCSLTGNALAMNEPFCEQDKLTKAYEQYKVKERKQITRSHSYIEPSLSDAEIVKLATEKNPKFYALYYGHWSDAGFNSQSEADLSLCTILAYWCDRNTDVMDRIFRESALYRDKWNREDYKNKTLERACNGVRTSRNEHIKEKLNCYDRQSKLCY